MHESVALNFYRFDSTIDTGIGTGRYMGYLCSGGILQLLE